jgi:hypothetical protein
VAHTVKVTAKDPFGNTATGYLGTVHFSSSDAAAVLPSNYTFTSSDAGAHTFTATLRTLGTQSLTATDTVTSTITGMQTGIVVRNQWQQTSVADFSAGTQSGTFVTNTSGGEVQLAPSFQDDFNGTALSSAWTVQSWAPQGGGPSSVTVSGGIVSVLGSEVSSVQTVTSTPVEGRVHFGAAANQNFGLATDLASASGNYWAVFGTLSTTNTLYARVNVNGTTTDVSLGALPTGYHVYRVQPISSGFQFYIDGTLKTTISKTFPSGTALKMVLSAFSGSPKPSLQADWVRLVSYPSSGTFTSSVFDAGRTATWDIASWSASVPSGTTLTVQVRSGNTATPDGSWSAWANVGNGKTVPSPSSRYLQYRIILTTTDPTKTPVLYSIGFTWN